MVSYSGWVAVRDHVSLMLAQSVASRRAHA